MSSIEEVPSQSPDDVAAAPDIDAGAGDSSPASGGTVTSAPVVTVGIGENKSEQTTIAGTLYQYFNEPAESQPYSADMGAPLEREDELRELTLIDEGWASARIRELQQRRILLLTGSEGTGKGTIAKYLAMRVADGSASRLPIRVVAPLEKRIRLVMRKAAEETKGFAGSATVLWNAFARRNADLLSFVTTERSVCEHVAGILQRHDGYLILTTPTIDLDAIRGRMTDAIACHEVPELPAEEIPAAVARKLTWIAVRRPDRAARVDQMKELLNDLIAEKRTMPAICRFIDEHVETEGDIRIALKNSDKGAAWFVSEIAGDVDAWCFALTLALTAAARDAEAVAWSTFDELRRAITERVRADTEMFPPRRFRSEAQEEIALRTAGASLADDLLMQRCGVSIGKDRDGVRDVVSFRSRKRIAEVWETLMTHHRRVISVLVPLLRRIAEKEQSGPAIRILAAQILGRIGEVDPVAITLPLIQDDWVGARRLELRPLVGNLLQGVAGSSNKKYHRVALDTLGRLSAVDPNRHDLPARNRLVTAIAAYAQLGDWDDAHVMRNLGEIAMEHCAPQMSEIHTLMLLAEKADRDRRSTRSKRRADRFRARGADLGQQAGRKLAEQSPILVALEQAVTNLCITVDVAQILTAMRDWMSKGGAQMQMLVTLLFVHEGGIADRLDDYSFAMDGGSIHPLLLSAAARQASLDAVCSFLADIYGCVQTSFSLPATVQSNFQERFGECLASWARGALPVPAYRETYEELFVALSKVRGKGLRPDLYRLLNESVFNEDEPMAALATSLRKRLAS